MRVNLITLLAILLLLIYKFSTWHFSPTPWAKPNEKVTTNRFKICNRPRRITLKIH